MREDWVEAEFEDLLKYIQPTNYIVKSTNYNDAYQTPVLTPGKSFIKGYTDEEDGIFEDLPAIIFDDFTTASRYVNFPFKVKSSAMKILKPTSELVNIKYVFNAMQTTDVRSDTHKRYWISIFAKEKIILPALPEQRAIVAKIEQLFSELNNGIANLKTAQDKLEIYRQAVLKKAFEGELTKTWREQQTDLPSADELLEQIKLERQRHYEQQLVDWEKAVETWEVNGKEGKKPKKPRPLDLSIRSDYESKLNTPFGWSECQVADIYNVLTDYHANGSYETLKEHVELFDEPSFAVMIRATNFEKNDFKENLKYISEDAYNFMSKSKLYGGEILIGKIGNAGRTYLMPNLNRKASLAMNLFALRINTINSKFFFYQLSSTCLKREISSYVKGVGNPTIDKKSVRSIHLNICSDKEQSQIVQEIESRLSVCDKLSDTIKAQLEKAEALRQSILKKAFEGRLLSDAEIEACKQEADWEPAEQLLARIKAESNNKFQAKSAKPKKRKKVS